MKRYGNEMVTYQSLNVCNEAIEEGVAGEREYTVIKTDFPTDYSKVEHIIISGTMYVNRKFTSGSPKTP